MARGTKSTPFPDEKLLRIIWKENGGVILSSDCHDTKNMAFGFEETKLLLKDIGFTYVYTLYNGEFIKDYL